MVNKAHTATIRRISDRYGGVSGDVAGVDIIAGELLIEVETWATLAEGIGRLSALTGVRYVAVTNKDAMPDALQLTEGTGIGVMDAQGHILKPAAGHDGEPKQLGID